MSRWTAIVPDVDGPYCQFASDDCTRISRDGKVVRPPFGMRPLAWWEYRATQKKSETPILVCDRHRHLIEYRGFLKKEKAA